MADTNHIRRDDYVEFSENDPFAELTRIMGHDPRVREPADESAPLPGHAAAAPADDDFAIDLERELTADFDFSEFDEPAAPADWREETRAVEPAVEAAPEPDTAALDAGFTDFFAGEAAAEPAAAPLAQAEPAHVPEAELDESLDDVLERELFSEQASFTAAEPAYEPEAIYEPEPAYEPEAVYEAEPAYEPEPVYKPEPLHTAPADEAAATNGTDDDWAAEAEFDLDFLERELAASAAPQAPASFEVAPREPVDEPAAQPLSLEDELSLLLADDLAPAPRHEPAATVFGRTNFAAAQPVAASAFVAPAAYASSVAADAAPVAAYAPAQPAAADDDPFGDDFALDLDDEASALPDVETVEVAEAVQPVADDLDIPDVDYGTQAAPGLYDDLEADFADVFGEAAPEEPTAASPAPEAREADAGYVLDDTQWQAAQAFPDAGFDYESDLEQAIAASAYEDEQPRPAPRRRGLMVAAAIGGIVALGAVGVLGMSMLGGGSDTPALVRADPEPMKVRPENPGGTTVPNQDNEVYQRVSGGQSDAAPAQESLITTAEEPVDVAARAAAPQEPAALAPGIDDEAPVEEAVQPKSEERIEQPPQATSPVEAGETVAVAPRRVRTMVVRPDGTMVPREDPAPAAAEPAVPAAVEQAAEQTIQQPSGVIGAPTLLAPAADTAEIDEGPTVETPQTVAVVPTQRSAAPAPQPAAPQPAAPQRAVQQPAAQAPVAAAPVSAPAAAAAGTSEWSMQIASQPTAEGAQSTYQDLARRYGSVLEGRGVSIVRADIEGRGTYYRVRIPASSREQAIQLCTRYKAAGGSCFVSR